MTETMQTAPELQDALGRGLFKLAYYMTLAGGLILTSMILMVVVSIVGRALFSAPVYGDFELVQMGTAASVFLFLPYCQMVRGNVLVDLLLARAPQRVKTLLDAAGGLLYGGLASVLCWRAAYGGLDMYRYNETSMILSIPVWIVFPFIVPSLAVLSVCCLYTAFTDFRRAAQ